MNKIILYIKRYLFFFLIILGIQFVLSIINIFGVPTSFLNTIINMLYFLVVGFHMGKYSKIKGYLNGLKYGSIIIIIMFIISLFLNRASLGSRLLYYFLLYLIIIFGNMLGSTKKGNISH